MKLGKLTDDLLDEVYDDVMRKFSTYRALDGIEAATPIVAYPIMSEAGSNAANTRILGATDKLYELIGYKETFDTDVTSTQPVLPEIVQAIFESEVGAPLTDINDLVRNM